MKTLIQWVIIFGMIAFLAYLFPYQAPVEPCPDVDTYLVTATDQEPLSVTPAQELEGETPAQYRDCPYCLEAEQWVAPPVFNSHRVAGKQGRGIDSREVNKKRSFQYYQPSHFEGKGYAKHINYWRPPDDQGQLSFSSKELLPYTEEEPPWLP